MIHRTGLVASISALFLGVAACGSSVSDDRSDQPSSGTGGDSGGTGGDSGGTGGDSGGTGGDAAAPGGTGGVNPAIGGTGPCNPWPTPMNDPACPDPDVVQGGLYISPCTPDLSCEFLVPFGDPCFQPPMLQRFQCCEWGFMNTPCPHLPEGEDPRCVLPILWGGDCDVEGLTCGVVVEDGQPTEYTCCEGRYLLGSSC